MNIVLQVVKVPETNIDYGDDGIPQSICSSCVYYGGIDAMQAGLICAIYPYGPELPVKFIDNQKHKICYLHSRAYTYHNCKDFVRQSPIAIPVFTWL
jgi:hypothetical protein